MQFAEPSQSSWKASPLRAVIEITICLLGFGVAGYAFSPFELLAAIELDPGPLLCALVFWIGWHWRESDADQWTGFVIIEQLCIGGGMSLLMQATLAYAGALDPTPLPIVAGGSLASGIVLAALHPWLYPRLMGTGVLLVGCGDMGHTIAAALSPRPLGAIESDPARVPAGVTLLGSFSEAEAVVRAQRPGRIIVDTRNWAECIPPRFLLACKLDGITLQDAAATYQRLFLRVSMDTLRPAELVWSPAFRANRLAMAAQTIYSNLAGLAALVTVSPLLAIVGIASRLAAGPGPIFEHVECAGFQGIPFWMLRFRTRDAKSGKTTWIGKIIEALRLTNLPQLINIVRGEMALFGPQPVRMTFVIRMQALIPFYTHKLTVKPGLFGWAQVHARGTRDLHEELLTMEYDIYYLTQCSPSLDLEILVRTLLGARRAPERPRGR